MEVKKQLELIKRGSEEFIGEENLYKKINEGRSLTVKFGADPTAPDLHLGHTVVMEKLRTFQDLGHKVVFIIGDFTAMIGDPSGRTSERPVLTKEEIDESVEGYLGQIFKVLARDNIEVLRNSEWLGPLGAEGIIRLTGHYTVARMLERNDFELRYKAGNPITITEFIYPLLQGYDSVYIKSDIELGGTDQKFNLLMGRELQKDYGQELQSILTMPLLEGLDGIKKMSKSYGNHIGIDETPKDIYGKIMSVSDELMLRYYNLLTYEDLESVKTMHPMDAKKKLAFLMVEKYHGHESASREEEAFNKVVSGGELPDDIPSVSYSAAQLKLVDIISSFENTLMKGDPLSKAEIKRRIKQGAVSVNGSRVKDMDYCIESSSVPIVIKYGKRKFLKVADGE